MLYFAAVFGVGFALGTLRVLWAVPHFGLRIAELMEAPIMFAVIIFAARWVVRRLDTLPTKTQRLSIGCIALGFLLGSEFLVVLWLRGLTLNQYFASKDPVSGTVYYVLLGMFAIMPLLVARK